MAVSLFQLPIQLIQEGQIHKMSKKLLLVNGPNLRLLGRREPEIYGRDTLQDIENACRDCAASLGFELACFQSDCEGELISRIGEAPLEGICGIVINPAGYTHTSVALHDALLAAALPAVEVHLSNIFRREDFRHTSITGSACIGVVAGFGRESYLLAIRALAARLS
jgi:3-dehydroquinate dehydratase-2